MKKPLFLFFCLFSFFSKPIFAQSFSLNSLFQTGFRASVWHTPPQNLPVRFGFSHAQLHLIVPVGGKTELDLKNFDIRGRQTFLNMTTGLRVPQTDLTENTRYLYNFSAGFTHLRAGLQNGIWLYSGTVGTVQDLGLGKYSFFGTLALAKIRIRGLRKQDIFGLGVAYFNNRFLPFPILGLNRRISENIDFRMLLPVQIIVASRLGKSVNLDFRLNSQVFATSVLQSSSLNQEANWRYNQFQASLLLGLKIAPKTRLWFEGGTGFGGQIWVKNSQETTYQMPLMPYVGLSLHTNFGRQLFGSQLFAQEQ